MLIISIFIKIIKCDIVYDQFDCVLSWNSFAFILKIFNQTIKPWLQSIDMWLAFNQLKMTQNPYVFAFELHFCVFNLRLSESGNDPFF